MSREKSFLRRVVSFCTSGALGIDPAQIAFVVPNKRAALFLKKYVRDESEGVSMLPRFMTMRTFLSIFADAPECNDRRLLFILYDAYRKVLRRLGRHESLREFDSFVFWGDMMLSDFDDIDRSLVNAADLFKNLKDVKEIQADYLDPEQKEVVRRIWGDSRLTTGVEEFWLHMAADAPEGSVSSKFLYLWEILAEIYTEFKAELRRRGLSTAGGQARSAVTGITNLEDSDLSGDTRFVFVGFNDLSTAETLIFNRLKESKSAFFFWDTAPLALCEDSREAPVPLRRLRELVKNFPAPDGFEAFPAEISPRIQITSVPSNVGQAKSITAVLKEWAAKGLLNPANPINTAIVLPDQNLLLPTLLAIPPEIESVNISMSLPFRTTTFASLLHSIISMQLRARRIHGIYHFFYEDVVAVLQHPHIRAVASDEADKVTAYISEGKLYNLAATEVNSVAPALSPVFTAVHDFENVAEVAAYLDNLLVWLGNELRAKASERSSVGIGGEPAPAFELEAIEYFRGELATLADLATEHGVEMTDRTFLQLFERVFASRGLTLSGKPLQGLQILGVLETRALDFDNVIILSMNEAVLPKKQYTRTMIPNNLRLGYGLPDFESLEWTYAYCFYRLMARASNVELFYDARSEAKGNGERSRYITQMKYLMPALEVKETDMHVGSKSTPASEITVEKTPEVLAELTQFMPGGRRKLSAAALKEYLSCPLSFYLKYVRGQRGSDELVDFLTAAEYGTIVHESIQAIFEPFENCEITTENYQKWLDPDNGEIERIVLSKLISTRFHKGNPDDPDSLNAEGRIALHTISRIVRANLKAESEKYGCRPFIFRKNEYEVNTLRGKSHPWTIDDNLTVNFSMSIDRVDETAPGYLRFIDFKTGSEETAFKNMDQLFDREKADRRGIFQVLTYCEAYLSLVDPNAEIKPMIHAMRELGADNPLPDMIYDKTALDCYSTQAREEFRPRLHGLLHEIFSKETPFFQTPFADNCRYCSFQTLCSRVIPEKY